MNFQQDVVSQYHVLDLHHHYIEKQDRLKDFKSVFTTASREAQKEKAAGIKAPEYK